jgi:hypothetical protein
MEIAMPLKNLALASPLSFTMGRPLRGEALKYYAYGRWLREGADPKSKKLDANSMEIRSPVRLAYPRALIHWCSDSYPATIGARTKPLARSLSAGFTGSENSSSSCSHRELKERNRAVKQIVRDARSESISGGLGETIANRTQQRPRAVCSGENRLLFHIALYPDHPEFEVSLRVKRIGVDTGGTATVLASRLCRTEPSFKRAKSSAREPFPHLR